MSSPGPCRLSIPHPCPRPELRQRTSRRWSVVGGLLHGVLLPLMMVTCAGTVLAAPPEPLSPIPEVLLAAPVQATWAANFPEQWRELGFSGLLFGGVLDDLAAERETMEAREEALVRELRIAHLRLQDAGLPHNYLRTDLSPEEPFFLRRSRADTLIENLAWLARLAEAADLPGLLLDTQTASFVHDFRWDGYPLDATVTPELTAGAHRLGARLARAFYRNHPEGQLLLLAQNPLSAGPLWFHFFEGLLTGTGAHNDIPIHLLVRSDRSFQANNELERYLQDIDTIFAQRLSEDAAQIWQRRGRIAPGLEPIGRVSNRTTAYYSPAQFRRQLLRSKLLAPEFVWVEATQGGWWDYGEAEARQYINSALEPGEAAISEVLPERDAYATQTPLDKLLRIGPAAHREDLDAYVLYEESGAAVVVWESLFDRWALPRSDGSVIARHLVSGQEMLLFPDGDHVVVPLEERPVLVRHLPFRDWVAPLSLTLSPDAPLVAGRRRANLELAYRNLGPYPLQGKLDAATGSGYSLGNALFDLNLAPQAAFQTRRTLQGVFRAGDAVDTRLTLNYAGGGSVQRHFSFPVQSSRLWRYVLDGPMRGAPILIDRDGQRNYRIILGSERGDLHALGPDGALHWQRRMRSGMSTAPLAWEGAWGQVFLSVTDRRGQVFSLDMDGGLLRDTPLRLEEAPTKQVALPQSAAEAPALAALRIWEGIEAVPEEAAESSDQTVGLDISMPLVADFPEDHGAPHRWGPVLFGEDSAIYFLDDTGDLHDAVLGQPRFVDAGAVRTPEGAIYLWRSFQEPAQVTGGLEIWDPTGLRHWLHRFEGFPTSPALIQHRGDGSVLWMGSSLGEILGFDLADGELLAQNVAPFGRPVRDLAHVVVPGQDTPWLLVLEPEGVHLLDADLEVQWFAPLRDGQRILGDLPGNTLLGVIATDGGDFVALTPGGSIAWRDRHAILPPMGVPVLHDINRDGHLDLLFGAGDGSFRAHSWQDLLFPRRPLDSLSSWGDTPATDD